VSKVLISKGTDVNYRATNDITPLHVAAKWGHNRMVSLLLDNGGNQAAQTKVGVLFCFRVATAGKSGKKSGNFDLTNLPGNPGI